MTGKKDDAARASIERKLVQGMAHSTLRALAADGVFILAVFGDRCSVAAAGHDEFLRALPELLSLDGARRGQRR